MSGKLVCTEFDLLMKALFNSSMPCPMVTALMSGGMAGLHDVVTGVGDLHSLISLSRVCMLSFVAFAAMSSLILLASKSFGTGTGAGEVVSRFSSWSALKRLADVMTGEVLGALIALIVMASFRSVLFLVRQFLV